MALVTGVLGSVIPKLALLLKDEYNLQKGLRKKITCLSRDLESMQVAFHKVAEVPTEELDEQVKLWARDVRELSYDVEDILDTFLVLVDGRNDRDPNRFKRAAKKIGKLFGKAKARHQIAGMIERINEQAEEIASRRVKYRVDEIVSRPAAPWTVDPRIEAMYKEVTQLVGIEKPTDELISKLSPLGDDEMKMVSVVGAGGLGKTTLAKAVYDKLKVDFEYTNFIPVGRDPDLKKVFRYILVDLDKEFMDPKYDLLDANQLIMKLRECLKDRRYFIVIDDIWDIDTWKSIMHALVQNNNGSRVITTTRRCDIADQAGKVYRLARLPRDQSEKLFYTRVFGAKKTCPNHLKELADKILNKCHDVPLAVITMASLLVGKTHGEWVEVCKSIVFRGKKKNKEVSDTEWILSLGYYDLPPHLKSCLLYLSAYPEDYLIKKDHLIWMWVAEGFIVDKEPGSGFFEVGEGYFNELINRSMIQAVESEYNYGTIDACRIHDMMLDLIRVMSHEENFFTILSTNVEGTSSTCRVRRLSCQTNAWVEPTRLDITQMRTFISFMDWLDIMDIQNFRLLRVLYLKVCEKEVIFENLFHLRYLKLVWYPFSKIKSIGALKFLQVLDLEKSGKEGFFYWFDNSGIEELPSSLGLLTQLICLRAGNVTVPNGIIEKLTSLQELQIRRVENDMAEQFVMDLGNLLELRVLHVGVDTESVVESNLVKSLGKLHKLQHLEVVNRKDLIANEAIWNAAVLPQPLQHFIIGFPIEFPVLPSCINPSDLPNLTRLDLLVCFMDEQSMRILGGLPELRHLNLRSLSTLTVNVHVDDDGFFQKLISLFVPWSTVQFALNEETTISFTIWNGKDDVAFGSAEKGEECIVRAPGVMRNLELLRFKVEVKALVRNKGSCDCLGLQYLPSLHKVKLEFSRSGAFADDVERQEAALRHAIRAHPNQPMLEARFYGGSFMRSRPAIYSRLADYTRRREVGSIDLDQLKILIEGKVGSSTDDEDVPEKEEATEC